MGSGFMNPPPATQTQLSSPLPTRPILVLSLNVFLYPPLFSAYFLSLLRCVCKLTEAFQGCLHLWSSHSGPHRIYQILKQQFLSGAHFETRYAMRIHIAWLPRDPVCTSLNTLVFEHMNAPPLRNGTTKSLIQACQILCHERAEFSDYTWWFHWEDEETSSEEGSN